VVLPAAVAGWRQVSVRPRLGGGAGLLVVPGGVRVRRDAVDLCYDRELVLVLRTGIRFLVDANCESLDFLSLDARRWQLLCQSAMMPAVDVSYRLAERCDASFVVVMPHDGIYGVDSSEFGEREVIPLLGRGEVQRETGEREDDDGGVLRTKVVVHQKSVLGSLASISPLCVQVAAGSVETAGLRLSLGAVVVLTCLHGGWKPWWDPAYVDPHGPKAELILTEVSDEYSFDGGGPEYGESEVSDSEYMQWTDCSKKAWRKGNRAGKW